MKASDEEIRKQVLEEDKKRDLGVYIGVTIAVFAMIAGMTGSGAVVMLRILGVYRNTIDGYWMSCIPFIFPAVTGISVAFKRRMIAIALHVPILLMASFSGGISFGYSIPPVFDTAVNCTSVLLQGDCEKMNLVYLYTAFGGVACGFSFLGILVSSCACQQARRRLQKKAEQYEMNKQRESHLQIQKTIQEKKDKSPSNLSNSYHSPPPKPVGAGQNGVHKATNPVYVNQVALSDDLTTKL